MMANPFQGDDVDPFSAVRDEEGNIQTDSKTGGVGEPMKMASFKEAFKEARNRGDKTFEYMGKKFTTEMAGERKPAATSSAKSESMDRASVASRKPGMFAKLAEMARNPSNPRIRRELAEGTRIRSEMKKGGKVKKHASGGSVSSASKRADGCAQRGKTKGRMV